MQVQLIDAGWSESANSQVIILEIKGEQWSIPTDETTAKALVPIIEDYKGFHPEFSVDSSD